MTRFVMLAMILTLALFSIYSPAFVASGHARSASVQVVTYAPDSNDVINPERGFRPSYDDLTALNDWHFGQARANGHSLVYSYIYLANYRWTDTLPIGLLQDINEALSAARRQGVKVILRVAYNFGPYPNSEPDAPLPRILSHINQLAPIYQANADVIAWFHAGFIGAWGEWHSSTHGLHHDWNAKYQVIQTLAAAAPGKFIQLRYPPDIRYFFPVPLSDTNAFSNILQARIGFHNDCFLSSETDFGTYHYDVNHHDGRPHALAYLTQSTRYVPAGGETCALYVPLQSCARAIQEMETLHFTDLNISYHPSVISYWQSQGCFETIRKRLGYRLVLQSAVFPTSVPQGGLLQATLHITNEGFAAPVNPRPVFLVLNSAQHTERIPVYGIDPRRWLPGERVITLTAVIPPVIPTGTYTLAVWLPDPHTRLQSDARYSIRFANMGTWDTFHGWNRLGTIDIVSATTQHPRAFLPVVKRP